MDEKKETYLWALNLFKLITTPRVVSTDRETALISALAEVFPDTHHIICAWHVNRNVLGKASQVLLKEQLEIFMTEWQGVIYSRTTEEFYEQWDTFQNTWNVVNRGLVNYLSITWIVYHTKLVKAWVDRVQHIGSGTTSRVEGNHASIKKTLGIKNQDLLTVFQKLNQMLELQYRNLNASTESAKIKVVHMHKDVDVMKHLLGRVSRYALDEIYKQFQMIDEEDWDINGCLGAFRSSYGLPCSHVIHNLLQRNGTLQLDD